MYLWFWLWGVLWWLISCRFVFVVCTVGSKLSFSLDKGSWGEEIKMVDQVFKQATMGILLFSLFSFYFPTIVFYLLSQFFNLVLLSCDFGEMDFVDLDILSHLWLVLIFVKWIFLVCFLWIYKLCRKKKKERKRWVLWSNHRKSCVDFLVQCLDANCNCSICKLISYFVLEDTNNCLTLWKLNNFSFLNVMSSTLRVYTVWALRT